MIVTRRMNEHTTTVALLLTDLSSRHVTTLSPVCRCARNNAPKGPRRSTWSRLMAPSPSLSSLWYTDRKCIRDSRPWGGLSAFSLVRTAEMAHLAFAMNNRGSIMDCTASWEHATMAMDSTLKWHLSTVYTLANTFKMSDFSGYPENLGKCVASRCLWSVQRGVLPRGHRIYDLVEGPLAV